LLLFKPFDDLPYVTTIGIPVVGCCTAA